MSQYIEQSSWNAAAAVGAAAVGCVAAGGAAATAGGAGCVSLCDDIVGGWWIQHAVLVQRSDLFLFCSVVAVW